MSSRGQGFKVCKLKQTCSSVDGMTDPAERLRSSSLLSPESSSGSFSSSDIYPAPGSASGSLSPSSSSGLSPLRPHPHLVPALPTFLRAVKERLLEAMTRADDGTVRWGEGLMLPGPSNAKDGESLAWIGGWGNSARYVVGCTCLLGHLHVVLAFSACRL